MLRFFLACSLSVSFKITFPCVCVLFAASPLKKEVLRSFRCKEKSLWFTLKILFCVCFFLLFCLLKS